MAKTYWEKLKDPRWQRKRLKIMERDQFACTNCGSDSETLNVHHSFYRRGFAPWDYDDAWLTTLCEDCHESTGKDTDRFFAVMVESADVLSMGFLVGYCLGTQMLESVQNGFNVRFVSLESDEEISGALASWSQCGGEKAAEIRGHIISMSGLVSMDDPVVEEFLKTARRYY